MRDICVDLYGCPEVLTLHEDVPRPEPGPEEVLVQVAYVGLNPLDFKIRDGSSARAEGLDLPAVTGREMMGVVIGAGSELDEAELGSRGVSPFYCVFGMRDPS